MKRKGGRAGRWLAGGARAHSTAPASGRGRASTQKIHEASSTPSRSSPPLLSRVNVHPTRTPCRYFAACCHWPSCHRPGWAAAGRACQPSPSRRAARFSVVGGFLRQWRRHLRHRLGPRRLHVPLAHSGWVRGATQVNHARDAGLVQTRFLCLHVSECVCAGVCVWGGGWWWIARSRVEWEGDAPAASPVHEQRPSAQPPLP